MIPMNAQMGRTSAFGRRAAAVVLAAFCFLPAGAAESEPTAAMRKDAAEAAIKAAAGLLVVGSSLMVYSGFRFVEFARSIGLGKLLPEATH